MKISEHYFEEILYRLHKEDSIPYNIFKDFLEAYRKVKSYEHSIEMSVGDISLSSVKNKNVHSIEIELYDSQVDLDKTVDETKFTLYTEEKDTGIFNTIQNFAAKDFFDELDKDIHVLTEDSLLETSERDNGFLLLEEGNGKRFLSYKQMKELYDVAPSVSLEKKLILKGEDYLRKQKNLGDAC
ncbi:MAG: hypothetical protein ACOCTT_03880 [archaeon]